MSLKRPLTPTAEVVPYKRATDCPRLFYQTPGEATFIETANQWMQSKEQGDLLVIACRQMPQLVLDSIVLLRTLIAHLDVSEWSVHVGIAAACLIDLTSFCSAAQLEIVMSAYPVNLMDVLTKNVVIAQSSQLREASLRILENCLRYEPLRLSFADMGCLKLLQSVGFLAGEMLQVGQNSEG